MLHRTASACGRLGKRPVVMYQVFRDGKHSEEYSIDLKVLSSAVGPTEIQIWLQEITLRLTADYHEIEKKINTLNPTDVPRLIRQAVCQRALFQFGDSTFARMA
jgi:hypothetical protein